MTLNLPFFFLLWIILFMWSMDFYQTLHPKAISYLPKFTGLHFILNLWSEFIFVIWVLRCIFFFFLLPQFTEEMVLPRENCFYTSVKYKLGILACGYFWFLYSVLLICVYTLSLATPQSWLLYLDNNSWNWPVIPPTLFFHSIVLDNP